MSAERPRFSVILISANRREMLLDALASLDPIRDDVEILLVDNGSIDGSAAAVRAAFPDVRLIEAGRNLGVAEGRNEGARHARGEILIFMDDDALLESPRILELLVDRFDADPALAVVAFRIVNAASGRTLSHEFPMRRHTETEIAREQPVAYFIGCGFAARRDTFLAVGGFYPAMTYGLEEVDLAYRLLDRGFGLRYTPDIVVHHRTPPEARRGARWYTDMMRSRVALVLRNLPLWAAIPHLAIWHLGLGLHAIRHGHLRGYLRGVVEGWRGARAAWATRRPIRAATARRVERLSGRLFY